MESQIYEQCGERSSYQGNLPGDPHLFNELLQTLQETLQKNISTLARFWWGGDDQKRKMHNIAIPKSSGGMGFQDIQLFNQSLLAKQAWRLLVNPDSLCSRVLKGKYFHDKDFLTATNKKSSSHIWKAILYGREALKKGLIKRVEDGSSIRVWDDPWITDHIGKRPIVRHNNSEITRVSDLIITGQAQWNEDKVTKNFLEPDTAAILSIPLGRFEDLWAWDPERNGSFTVRSCYRLLAAEKIGTPQQSSSSEQNFFWKRLWKLQVPPKSKPSGGECYGISSLANRS